jgi:uncharacterized protein
MYKTVSRLILSAILVLTMFFGYRASKLGFDYNFENFFPTGDPDLEYYLEFRNKFEFDTDYLFVGVENNDGIFKEDFLKKISSLTDNIKQLPWIVSVVSPTNVKNPVVGPLGIIEIPYLHINQPELYEQDSVRIYNSEFIGTVFASDAKSVCLYLKTVENPSKAISDSIISGVEEVTRQFGFDKIHIAGKVKAQQVYLEQMSEELKLFVTTSVILVTLFLYLAFGSLKWIVIPIFVIMLTLIWLFGIMNLSGKPIDLMATLIPTIIFVVGMSDMVHLLSKYFEEIRSGSNKISALKTSIKEVGTATFLTSLTTSIGFLTLLTAGIQPVKDFGLYLAIGVFIAYFLTFLILPSILVNLSDGETIGKFKFNWNKYLGKLYRWVLRNPRKILVGSLVVLLLCFVGITQIKLNNYLLDDLTEKVQLKKDFDFFEEKYAGARSFEIVVETKDSALSVMDHAALNEIYKLEQYLTREYGAGYLISPLTLIKSMNKAFNGGHEQYFTLPSSADYDILKPKINSLKKRKEYKAFISEDGKVARISGKMPDYGSYIVNQKNEQLEKFIKKNINGKLVDFKLTGGAHLIDKNNTQLVSNMIGGLLIAFIVIAIIAGLMFKSVTMTFIALIPNMFPLLMIAGIMGFFGIDMKVSTSIIFTIAFGIAVDDTIHFLSKLRGELAKGKSMLYALKRTYLSTGKAIIITTIILCGGFLTLIASDFRGTFYIGLLISLTLLFAVLADLLLLPVLLLIIFKNKGLK